MNHFERYLHHIYVDVCEIHSIIEGCESSNWLQKLIKYPLGSIVKDVFLKTIVFGGVLAIQNLSHAHWLWLKYSFLLVAVDTLKCYILLCYKCRINATKRWKAIKWSPDFINIRRSLKNACMILETKHQNVNENVLNLPISSNYTKIVDVCMYILWFLNNF